MNPQTKMCNIRFLRRRGGRCTRYFPRALQPLHSAAVTSVTFPVRYSRYTPWPLHFRGGGWVVLPLARTSTLRPVVSVNWHPRFSQPLGWTRLDWEGAAASPKQACRQGQLFQSIHLLYCTQCRHFLSSTCLTCSWRLLPSWPWLHQPS